MRTILFLSLFLVLTTISKSQNSKLDTTIEYLKSGDLPKAKKVIDEFFYKKDIREPKAWMYRGFVYQAIYENDSVLIKNLDNDPINKSYNSYLEAIRFDSIKEYLQTVIKSLRILSNEFTYEGISEFNKGNYEKAYENFNNTLNINKMASIMLIDTIIIYNAALAAEKCGKYDKAEELYQDLISFRYGGLKLYSDLASLYYSEKKFDLMVRTLCDGIKYFPDDNENKYVIITKLINYYLEISNMDEAVKYIQMSLNIKTENSPYWFLLGSYYEQKGQEINAEKNYKKALEFDSLNVDALFNLGALYYNQGVDLIKKSMDKKQKAEADSKYSLAMPIFERYLKINPDDIQVIKLLKNIYTILGKEKELNLISKRIEIKEQEKK